MVLSHKNFCSVPMLYPQRCSSRTAPAVAVPLCGVCTESVEKRVRHLFVRSLGQPIRERRQLTVSVNYQHAAHQVEDKSF